MCLATAADRRSNWLDMPPFAPEPNYEYLVPLRTSGSGPALFCFPGSGGNVFIFREMVAALGDGNPVYGIDLEWLCDSRHHFTVEQIAEFYLDVIRKRQECGPYYFCGYSFGGLVAYEMARQLIACDRRAGLVALLDTPNPALIKNLSQTDSAQFRKTYLIDRLRKYALHLLRGEFRSLGTRGLAFVTSRAGQFFMPTIKKAFQIANRPLPAVLKSNDPGFLRAWHSYVPNSYDKDVVCFRVEDRGPEHASDPSMGWEVCVTGKVHVHTVPGGHVDMMAAPSVFLISQILAGYLDQSSTRRAETACSK
jgi:thioesterase domain-containing protein